MSNEQNVSGGDEVEAVARAIADCNWRSDAGEDWCAERFNDPDMRPLYLKQARAAISTIRQRSGGVELDTISDGELYSLASFGGDALAKREFVDRLKASSASPDVSQQARELLPKIAHLFPITTNDTPDYAELYFGTSQTQAMTMEPNSFHALNDFYDAILVLLAPTGNKES